MKYPSSYLSQRRTAFTLIELLVVIAIIMLLAGMTLGVFSMAQRSAMRDRTRAFHAAIKSGLEAYNSEYGEYPEPAGGGTQEFHGRTYQTGGALMLYQALSGDGSNAIKIAGGGSASDGKWDDNEKMLLTEMPKEMYNIRGKNSYMLVDGFGHPFQYSKGGTADAVNTTYDLWSYSDDESNTNDTSAASKRDAAKAGKWIKNF